MAYSVGAISGGHFNPAVSLAMLLNKRLSLKDFVGYVISQFIGAIVASAIVFDLVHELGLSTKNLGQTDFPNISVGGAFITETLVTFLFILVILLVTSNKWGNANFAGLVIGITLALMIIVALNLTGGSLNPARSFGPALFAGGSAMSHYWLYLVAPLVGAVLELSGKKQAKSGMRDRDPAVIMLRILFLFCRAVLELSGKKQAKSSMQHGDPAVIMLRIFFLTCRAVLELSGKCF